MIPQAQMYPPQVPQPLMGIQMEGRGPKPLMEGYYERQPQPMVERYRIVLNFVLSFKSFTNV
jgi:hypothetical protein